MSPQNFIINPGVKTSVQIITTGRLRYRSTNLYLSGIIDKVNHFKIKTKIKKKKCSFVRTHDDTFCISPLYFSLFFCFSCSLHCFQQRRRNVHFIPLFANKYNLLNPNEHQNITRLINKKQMKTMTFLSIRTQDNRILSLNIIITLTKHVPRCQEKSVELQQVVSSFHCITQTINEIPGG